MLWVEGPPIPAVLTNMTNVQLSDGFSSIGGWPGGAYKFNQDSYQWEVIPEALKVPKSSSAAAAVPDEMSVELLLRLSVSSAYDTN
jgi:hypothetical protein